MASLLKTPIQIWFPRAFDFSCPRMSSLFPLSAANLCKWQPFKTETAILRCSVKGFFAKNPLHFFVFVQESFAFLFKTVFENAGHRTRASC
jgi:hypothetical protein